MFLGPITYYGGKPPKGRVAKIIHPQEKLIFATHFHIFTIAKFWIPFAVSALITIIVPALLPAEHALNAVSVLAAVTVGTIVYGLASTYLWSHEWFVVTDQRVILIKGVFIRKVPQMPAKKVTDMTYERSVAGMIFGYGTFIFESAGQVQALSKISYVPNPDELHNELATAVYDLAGKKVTKAKKTPRFGNQFRKWWHWLVGRPQFDPIEEIYDPKRHDALAASSTPIDSTAPPKGRIASAKQQPPAPQQAAHEPKHPTIDQQQRQPSTTVMPEAHTEELPTVKLGTTHPQPALAERTTRRPRLRPSSQLQPASQAAPIGRQRARAAAQQQREQLRDINETTPETESHRHMARPPVLETPTAPGRSTRSGRPAPAPKVRPKPKTVKASHKQQRSPDVKQQRPQKPAGQRSRNELARDEANKLLEEWDHDWN